MHQAAMGITAIATVAGEIGQAAGVSPISQRGCQRQHAAGVLAETVNDEDLRMDRPRKRESSRQ